MKTRILLLAACLVLGAAISAHATVRALVIGIDEYPGGDRLPSCINDARGMTDLLMKQFGVPEDNVRVLLNAAASANGIRKAFKEHLINNTKPGDDAFFYFSGHGAVVPNWTSESGGRLIKVLVTHHTGKTSILDLFTHTELKALLGQLQTTNITVVLDCCHAGSMTKSLTVSGAEDKIKVMNIGFGAAERFLAEEPREETQIFSKSANTTIPVLWLGACLSNQVSYCGSPMSRFTGTLVEQLKNKHSQTVAEVFPAIQAKVEQKTRMIARGVQTPILEGPAERPLVKAAADRLSEKPTVTTPDKPTIQITALRPDDVKPPVLGPPSRQDFPLRVWIDRTQYTAGDEMKVEIRAGADCYLRLYLMSCDTTIQQLFPNQYATNNFIPKGQIVEIPAPNTFVLRMGEPFGTETLLAVGSLEQFSDLNRPSFTDGGFQDLGNMPPARMGTRGIKVEEAKRRDGNKPADKPTKKISYSSVQYSVKPR